VSDKQDDSTFWLAIFVLPIVIVLMFPYLFMVGLQDLRVGRAFRWTSTILVVLGVLAAIVDGLYLVAAGMAFGFGLLGLGMVIWAGQLRRKTEEVSEESDASGPRWRFS
jgi:hypothetical protein